MTGIGNDHLHLPLSSEFDIEMMEYRITVLRNKADYIETFITVITMIYILHEW